MSRAAIDDGIVRTFAAGLAFARAELDPDITAQRLLILLHVYLEEGLSQRELLDRLAATSVTALSRNLSELSDWSTRKIDGLGLIELRPDRLNLRRKQVFLTPKGKRFVARWLRRMSDAGRHRTPTTRRVS